MTMPSARAVITDPPSKTCFATTTAHTDRALPTETSMPAVRTTMVIPTPTIATIAIEDSTFWTFPSSRKVG